MRSLSFLRSLAVLAIAASACPVFTGESRPTSQGDIQKAVERARTIRAQKKIVPNVLQSSALIMKIGEVRCGQALLKIEDAKGEGGAEYKLTERFKAGMSEEGQSVLVDCSNTFLLAADLALISGEMRVSSDVTLKADGKKQQIANVGTLSVKDDTLFWQNTERKNGSEARTGSRKIALHGIRPLPMNALLALAALVNESEKDGWKPDPKNALCVPVIAFDGQFFVTDSIDIQPAWLSFDQPAYTHPKGTAAVMRVRTLVGEVSDKGLEIEPPSPQVWMGVQTWALDGRAHALNHPAPEDARVKIEIADPASVDLESPIDMEKIEKATVDGAPRPVKK